MKRTEPCQASCLLALCVSLSCNSALAEITDDGSALSIAGFGTVSMVRTDGGEAIFLPFGNQSSGAQSAWVGGLDSLLALQAHYRFIPHASMTVQLTARRDADNAYVPDVDWAYLSVQASPGMDLRVGRFVAPLFAASDTRMVGYANLWVRPPVEVYTLGINGVDGADLIWRHAWSGTAMMAQVWGGKSRQRFPRNGAGGLLTNQAAEYEQMLGINLSLQQGGLGLRFAQMRARQMLITTRGRPENGLNTFGSSQSACIAKENLAKTALLCRELYQGFSTLEQNYDVNDAVFRFSSVGINYEVGAWRWMAEAIALHHQSRIANSKAAYATVARSFGSLTPYFTFAWHQAQTKVFEVEVKPEYAALVKPSLKSYRPAGSAGPAQSGQSIGLRWDARPGLALKMQVDRMKPRAPGNGIGDLNRVGLVGRNLADSPAIHIYNLSADFAF